jgi:hypothetical protein
MSNASSSPAPIAAKIDLVPLYTIIGRLNLPGAALAVIPPDATPSLALDALVRAGYGTAALRLVAHSLPKREAVWWACMCAEHTAPDPLPQAELAVAHSAQAWVRRPHDEAGFAAYALAERCGMRSAECWTAVAANWCGSTLSGPGLPPVAPPPHLPGIAVYGAVALALARAPAEQHPAVTARFISSARDIATGGAGRLRRDEPMMLA